MTEELSPPQGIPPESPAHSGFEPLRPDPAEAASSPTAQSPAETPASPVGSQADYLNRIGQDGYLGEGDKRGAELYQKFGVDLPPKEWKFISRDAYADLLSKLPGLQEAVAKRDHLDKLASAIEGATTDQAVTAGIMGLVEFAQAYPSAPVVELGLDTASVLANATKDKESGVVPPRVLEFAMNMLQMKAAAQSGSPKE